MLRMDAAAGEPLGAGEGRQIARVVVVIARAADEVATRVVARLARRLVHRGHRPATLGGRPVSADDLQPVLDLLVDAVLDGGVGDVLADRRPVGQHLQLLPRPELVAEGEHVRIGADARVAEQVPGAAEALAALQHREGLVRKLGGQLSGRPDARQTCADDQDVEMLCVHD